MLAIRLQKTVGWLEEHMSPGEFDEWLALDEIAPWSYDRDADLRNGIVTSALVNTISDIVGAEFEPKKPSDYMPREIMKLTIEQDLIIPADAEEESAALSAMLSKWRPKNG